MKSFILILIGLVLLNLTQEVDCHRKSPFGKKEICLPTIDGYQECYLEAPITEMADATEVPTNRVLGYYLDTMTYNRKSELGTFQFDNYFKIYGTLDVQDYEAQEGEMDQIFAAVKESFVPGMWEETKGLIDEKGLGVQVGQPVLLEDYRFSDQSFTCVALISYSTPEIPDVTMAMTVNGLLLHNRIVWMAYYLMYENADTLIELKNNSNILIDEILKANM